MKLLVTGGGGFIGRNLVEGLADRFVVDAPASGELDLLATAAVQAFFAAGAYDVVVHAATWDATRTSTRDPRLVLENNLRMFHNVARCGDSFGRLVHLGSGAEYDRARELDGVAEAEFGAVVPGDQYGFGKYVTRTFCETRSWCVNLSLFGVFGKHEDWRLRFLSNACCHAVFDLPIEIGRDSLFDYISVDDVVEAVAWCATHEPERRSYNVCSGVGRSLVELAHVVRDASGKDLPIEVHAQGRDPAYVGDPSLFVAESGWGAAGLEGKVAELYAWFEQTRDGIDPAVLAGRAWLHDEAGSAAAGELAGR